MMNFLLNHIEAIKVAFRRLLFAKAASLVMFLIIGITTCLPMSALLLLENIKQASSQIEYSAEMSIFLVKKYKDDELKTFTSFLEEQPIISKITFEKKEDAWVKLQKKIMIDGESLIEKNPLPDSFYLSLATLDDNEIDYFIKEIKDFAIIDDVLLDSAWVNKLDSILSLGELIINFLGILLLSIIAVIIGNTIRLQALSFKDEIEVSKLIGASNAFIRRPFLYTGIFYGFGGAVINIAITKLMVFIFNYYAYIIESIIGLNIYITDLIITHYLSMTILCVAIGWLASYFSTNRTLYKIKNDS